MGGPAGAGEGLEAGSAGFTEFGETVVLATSDNLAFRLQEANVPVAGLEIEVRLDAALLEVRGISNEFFFMLADLNCGIGVHNCLSHADDTPDFRGVCALSILTRLCTEGVKLWRLRRISFVPFSHDFAGWKTERVRQLPLAGPVGADSIGFGEFRTRRACSGEQGWNFA